MDSEFDSLDIDAETGTAVFRIFQEALTNAARHANAQTVEIKIGTFEGNTTVTITDDGVGINLRSLSNKQSLGILGMRERARLIGAALDISNGNGTTVRLTLPNPASGGLL